MTSGNFCLRITRACAERRTQIKEAMDGRFGHKAMKESYMTEAKLRKKRDTESFRDFGTGYS